jgi:copper resistance protein D
LFDPLIDARVLYFAATLLVAGVVFFVVCIAAPAWRGDEDGSVAVTVRPRLAWLAWFGLGLALTSGVVWLIVTAAGMSGRPPLQVFDDGVLWTVLTQTTFGHAWLVRFVVACILAGLFVPFFTARPSQWIVAAVTVLAAVFVGALAWAGHAAGGLGVEAFVHPTADVLHLIAAAAWVGALIPLAVLFAAAGKDDGTLRERQRHDFPPSALSASLRSWSLGASTLGTSSAAFRRSRKRITAGCYR